MAGDFPEMGECPINAISFINDNDHSINIFLLRNEKNPLIEQFEKNQDNIPLYSSYIAKYGDERALPLLLKTIENEKLNYADFEELRFAIEALGGEYNKIRDFSKDKSFKKIKIFFSYNFNSFLFILSF